MDTEVKLKNVLYDAKQLRRSLSSLKYGLSKEEEPKQRVVKSFVKSEIKHAESLEKRCAAILHIMYPEKTEVVIKDEQDQSGYMPYWPDDL